MGADVSEQTPSKLLSLRKLPEFEEDKSPLARRESLDLVRAYYKVSDPAVCKQLYNLVKAIAK